MATKNAQMLILAGPELNEPIARYGPFVMNTKSEILDAVKLTIAKVQNEELNINQLDETFFSQQLYTKNIPDPDLMIRTSGEYRLSNFLLWQSAYTEIYMTDAYWPSFREQQLIDSINDYQNRERRFGKGSYQLKELCVNIIFGQ